MKELLTLNRKEQKRLMVLNKITKRELSIKEGSAALELSERQVWRLLSGYRKEGASALAHGNRGRKPYNMVEESLKLKVIELAKYNYTGFNHQHLTEKLQEKEGIKLCRSTVRNILTQAGIGSPRKRRLPRHRSRRERYSEEGMLLQVDGSPHDWLEGRGPRLCLIGAIDDATNNVPYAFFQEHEDTIGYMRLLQEIVLTKGIPAALYHDRHSVFTVSREQEPSLDEQLNGKVPLTQMGRLLKELGITSIAAKSPQAKGRVERLWGTFQDRLISELRLAGVTTLQEANRLLECFLPEYNQKFAIEAREPQIAYRKLEEDFHAEEYFCFKYPRSVGADNVVRFRDIRLQILPAQDRLSYARCRVEVHQRLDGSVAIYYQGKPLPVQPAPLDTHSLRKSKLTKSVSTAPPTRKPCTKPSPNHPWRRPFKALPIKADL